MSDTTDKLVDAVATGLLGLVAAILLAPKLVLEDTGSRKEQMRGALKDAALLMDEAEAFVKTLPR